MDEIKTKLGQVIKKLFGVEIQVELTVAPEETGADYATNVAMKLAKVAHKAPMMIAEEIKTEVDGGEFKVEIAAPGFMNFTLSDEYFAEKAKEGIIPSDEYSGKTVVAEFSDPNPFKVLHVGHLYTSIVGDSISRLLEFAGARVIRANFGGDVGLHVGKTLYALLRSNYSFGDINIEDIAKCYVEGTRAYEEDEMAKAEITKLNKEIYAIAELGEEKSMERLELEKLAEDFEVATEEMAKVAQLYWLGRRLSYEYFEQFYDSIGVKFDKYYPESTVADRGLKEVREHVGTVYEESEGAVVFRGEKVGLHTRVFINREGIPTYETKDVGLIFTKWADWHFDESVVITGNEQSDYMKVVLASVKEYAPELVERTRHLTHGLVKLPGNVKMSSRKGNFLKAVDVIELVEATLLDSSASADALLSRGMSNTASSATPASLNNLEDNSRFQSACVLKGSGRSFGEFNLAEALAVCGEYIIGGGGHAAACGVKVAKDKLEKFREAVNEYYRSLKLENQERFLGVQEDLEVEEFEELSLELIEEMRKLEPYGEGNQEPVFLLPEVRVVDVAKLGAEGKHLRLTVWDKQGKSLKLMQFFASEENLGVQPGAVANVWMTLAENEFRGIRSVEGRILKLVVL